MTTRRTILALAAGSVALAGCASPGDGSGTGLTLEAFDVTVAPGSDARVEVQATEVGGLTWGFGEIPQAWQIAYEDFDPEPTAVQESYPPTLLWDPAVSEVSGAFVVSVPADAEPGSYTLTVEAQAATGDERAVSEATVTVQN